MTEATAFNLGLTQLEKTPKVLRMADQSRVVPVGKLNEITTLIGGVAFLLDYIIIRPEVHSSFPLLLGRPWLYAAKVKLNWEQQELSFGKPRVTLNWAGDYHLGETQDDDGYTSDFSDSSMVNSEKQHLWKGR